ncbi:MAG: tryptophan synthase subunit alpha [Actinomycetota bacterium]|nr:tryptophan synthase subunit alpha [Actinomycetota bacterium]
MSRISERFASGKLLIPYIMGGWPDMATSAAVFRAFIKVGCPVIEIGIPYSDPVADGPTIQRASERALDKGVNTDQVLNMIAGVAAETDVSPVLMVYYNLIYRYGIKRFAQAARRAGVEGLIVPDLTVEESHDWRSAAEDYDIDTIFLASPTSSEERLAKIGGLAKGFVYAVSLTGVTGARAALPEYLKEFIARVKSNTELPVAVGFGISQPEQAAEVARSADGVIIGSAIIDLIERTPTERLTRTINEFGAGFLSAMRQP